MSRRRGPCRVALRLWCLPAATIAIASIPAAAQEIAAAAAQRYDIPAQPLDAALTRLATASGIDILYDHGLAAGRSSAALAGTFTPQAAIRLLLQGTGLDARFTGPRAAVIAPAGRAAAPAATASPGPSRLLALDVLRVTAAPLVGSPDTSAFDAYARRAQSEIYRRLADGHGASNAAFRIEVAVSLDADGAVRAVTVSRGSGDGAIDRAIARLIDGICLPQPPPAGLPQPLRFRLLSR